MIVNRFSRLVGDRRTSVLAVSKATGIARSGLHALYHGRSGGMSFANIDKLCAHFEVEVCELLEWVRE